MHHTMHALKCNLDPDQTYVRTYTYMRAGAIEAELAREIEKLRSVQESGGELEGDVWGDEDDDEEEEEDDDDELWEEDEAGEHTGDDESLVDWPVEEEPEDYSALLSDGWVDMDSILVRDGVCGGGGD